MRINLNFNDLNSSEDGKRSLQVERLLRRAILSRMGKMVRTGGTIRPRKNTGWPANSFKTKEGQVFKIDESDFPVNLPAYIPSYNSHSNQTLNEAKHKKVAGSLEKSSDKKKSLLKQIEEYCEHSTLHGLRYVGDSQLTFGERIFWFISFSLAIGFAAYYISNIYTKWKSSPVIISFSPFDADLRSIPFPAITICNMNQAKRDEAEKILKDGSFIERKLLDDSCNGNATFNSSENINWESLRNFLIRVGNSCSDILKWCQWGNDVVNCGDIFNNDLTDEGLCCSFNRLPPDKIFRNWKDVSILNQTYPSNVYDWNAEKGFQDVDGGDFIPRRPLGAGAHLGLSVVLDAQIDNYYCSSTRSTGFKAILSNPLETPKMADFGFLISPGFETRIAIEPSVREATLSLRDIPIEKRQCYFANERPLQYYRSYTQRNCLLECQSTHTLKLCGCVPYYLPKNKSIKYCGKSEKECSSQAKQDMEITVAGNSSSCYCLPACFSVKYTYGKSMASLSRAVSDDLQNYSLDYFGKNIASLHFFFYTSKFTPELKTKLFGFTEILSNTGGLLSLFLGFSFLSLVELIYFISLRLGCHIARSRIKRHGKKEEMPTFQFVK